LLLISQVHSRKTAEKQHGLSHECYFLAIYNYLYQLTLALDTCLQQHQINRKKKNSMVWVRERTIPTERPPLFGEVVANFYG
jgi:hypothetical protein